MMLIRVERTGKEQRETTLVHAEDAREYLLEKLGAKPEEIRLKTSEDDELGDEDLLQPSCAVRYIITKAALQEGWDCPFAYVLAILSKTTANTALTQMIGRVLRQPHTRLTHRAALDESYVFTFDQDVTNAVESVRKGLEEEGMADIASAVKVGVASGATKRMTRRETVNRRAKFAGLPPIFLPRVLHRDGPGFRLLDYERDILGELNWGSFRFIKAGKLDPIEEGKLTRTIARIDMRRKKEQEETVLELIQQPSAEIPEEGLDEPFLVRQLLDVIPNPWQGMRVIQETLAAFRGRGWTEGQIYASRLDILREMKLELRAQVNNAAEALFAEKLASGSISFRLVSSNDPALNWKLAETLEIELADDDRPLLRKDGGELDQSLFEKVFARDFNELEKETAWYLDGKSCVHWWHRIAVGQDSYGLQGWQRHRVFPDFLACIHGTKKGKFRFSVLETKGDHLKGNDDTEYKRRLFDVLTQHASTAIDAGELLLGTESEQLSFTMLLEGSWQQALSKITKD